MFQNYFKIAWRNLFRNKGFSVTNILGLTIGMTCTILIFLWVQDELPYNKFHSNYSNIYRVMANRDFNNQIFSDENMVLPLAQSIRKEIAQVKYVVVTTHSFDHFITYDQFPGNKSNNSKSCKEFENGITILDCESS